MRRIFFVLSLFFISFNCFAQGFNNPNLPEKIIGKIPDKNSTKKYQVQVGAYEFDKNTQAAMQQLKNQSLTPSTEKFRNLTRVLIKDIPANRVTEILITVRRAGFKEVIIREDTPSISSSPSIPSTPEIIEAPAKKEPSDSETALLSQTWKIIDCPNAEFVGCSLTFSEDGTYFITTPLGVTSSVSKWRWYGSSRVEFEYSHDDWEYYGRSKITDIGDSTIGILDPGYSYEASGYSDGGFNNVWSLSAIEE
jgi:hypothetical protein